MTVSQWKQNRFYPYYPGLEVDVLDVVGIAVSGQTKFKNVRNARFGGCRFWRFFTLIFLFKKITTFA